MEHEHEHEHHIIPERTYIGVFIALLVLLVISVGIVSVDLGVLNYPVALGIAVVKAVLVILYFMHVIYSTNLTKLFVAAGFFWVMILLLLTLTDFLTRTWLPIPGH